MIAYSQDLRERAINACQRGEPVSVIARRLEVSESWVRRVYRRFQETGERASHRLGGYRVSCLASWKETIEGWIAEKPDLTLAEIVERLDEQGVAITTHPLWRQLKQWGLRFKKKPARSRAAPPRRASRA